MAILKSKEEIESLKRNWESDPCWDIETTEGFEAHHDELLDRAGGIVATHVSYGATAIAAMFDQFDANEALWPPEAWSISEVWERTETVTTFKRIPQQPNRRNPANGRFMRTSYRENQNL